MRSKSLINECDVIYQSNCQNIDIQLYYEDGCALHCFVVKGRKFAKQFLKEMVSQFLLRPIHTTRVP